MGLTIVKEIDDFVKIRNILISVSDKSNLDIFINNLLRIIPDIKIFSTGGTYDYLSSIKGITEDKNLLQISDYTKQPEMQGGLVKTLDFRIYTGILSEKYNENHKNDLKRTKSIEFDMVIVNLYPFSDIIKNKSALPEEARTNIDIGGPCMLRASAKNFHRVTSVCNPSFYASIAEELKNSNGKISLKTRFKLAKDSFRHTSIYDKTISAYLSKISYKKMTECYRLHN